jgi:NAD(P)-dependent dehydrogenase (short-subunit alcohol dehydrogenase family)
MTTTDDSPIPDYASLLRLDGKTMIVVGAGQGIGRQVAHALAQVGARVVCVDVEQTRADEIASEAGGVAWSGDATDRADVERMLAFTHDTFGHVDGFVDIIGLATFLPFMELTDDQWDLDFRLCLRHAFLMSQIAGRHMIEQGDGGTMVFVSSISGLLAAPHHAAYGAAKAGLINLVRSLADELGPRGIRVNSVSPGAVRTPRINELLTDEQIQLSANESPLGRMAWPTDIARAALFLSSDLSSYVTGQILAVDGGVGGRYPFSTPDI